MLEHKFGSVDELHDRVALEAVPDRIKEMSVALPSAECTDEAVNVTATG